MFQVYVLQCRDGSFYTGYTNDVQKRVSRHSEGKASRYTRSRLPIKLVAKWSFPTRKEAMQAEARFKRLPRKDKERKIRDGCVHLANDGCRSSIAFLQCCY
jgi:putative endonuclease